MKTQIFIVFFLFFCSDSFGGPWNLRVLSIGEPKVSYTITLFNPASVKEKLKIRIVRENKFDKKLTIDLSNPTAIEYGSNSTILSVTAKCVKTSGKCPDILQKDVSVIKVAIEGVLRGNFFCKRHEVKPGKFLFVPCEEQVPEKIAEMREELDYPHIVEIEKTVGQIVGVKITKKDARSIEVTAPAEVEKFEVVILDSQSGVTYVAVTKPYDNAEQYIKKVFVTVEGSETILVRDKDIMKNRMVFF